MIIKIIVFCAIIICPLLILYVSLISSKSTSSDASVDIVKTLKIRYEDLLSNCSDSKGLTKPAYDCSGLIIRGVNLENSEIKFAWSKKPSNRRTNAFSVAFLRKDQLFSEFPHGYDTGFIVYPRLRTPSNRQTNELEMFCAFPSDAHTDGRDGQHGCGKILDDKFETSRSCNVQGINSLATWISHYQNITSNKNDKFKYKQCGFDLTSETAALDFQVALGANIFLRTESKEYSYKNNELRIEAWNDENCKEIPIETFFYIIDLPGAVTKAERHRDEFYECSGLKLPIVGLRLPSPDGQDLTIENY